MNTVCVRLPGHPDAACDIVAEAIVDEYTRRDPLTRISLSVTGGRGALFVAGDVKSDADFDVAHVMHRTLGQLGVGTELEPFVSLERVVGDRATIFQKGAEMPVVVMGYATGETEEMIPATLLSAQRIAHALEERRTSDENWFWLGADGDVFVSDRIFIRIEHGVKPLEDARREIAQLVAAIEPKQEVRVNELGPDDVRGIGNLMGSSGRGAHPYGTALPSPPPSVGLDITRAEKAGTWLARQAAKRLVARGARAVLIRVTYLPGERTPVAITARDERGKDLSREINLASLSLDRVMSEWWRPNLCVDAARWGFVCDPHLPWEKLEGV